MAADECSSEEDADRETNALRARIVGQLIAAVRGLPADAVPGALCRSCLELLPAVSGLSVTVEDGAGSAVVLCASDAVAARLAELQYTLGEGPCSEAVRLRAPVFAADLTAAPDTRRWPMFASQAIPAGVRAAFSIPLTGAFEALGTLDLYRDKPGGLTGDQLRTALLVADAFALVVNALGGASQGGEGVVAWLEDAVSDREEIHQATGMIMVRLGVSAEEAGLRLRALAFAQGRTSRDVALDIVNRTLDVPS
ncbi:GAF and ANTAR domain-containing protein [Streptomyces sp. NPDC060011]|uniref:GAF and ANTAR domain-containing protein n=1 Tax=Streptomyces sp. NPDC060011 TaxID=3347037 RepID=UPI0036A50635